MAACMPAQRPHQSSLSSGVTAACRPSTELRPPALRAARHAGSQHSSTAAAARLSPSPRSTEKGRVQLQQGLKLPLPLMAQRGGRMVAHLAGVAPSWPSRHHEGAACLQFLVLRCTVTPAPPSFLKSASAPPRHP